MNFSHIRLSNQHPSGFDSPLSGVRLQNLTSSQFDDLLESNHVDIGTAREWSSKQSDEDSLWCPAGEEPRHEGLIRSLSFRFVPRP